MNEIVLSEDESASRLFIAVSRNAKDTESAKEICYLLCNKMKQENDFYFKKFGAAKYKSDYWPNVKQLIQEIC